MGNESSQNVMLSLPSVSTVFHRGNNSDLSVRIVRRGAVNQEGLLLTGGMITDSVTSAYSLPFSKECAEK